MFYLGVDPGTTDNMALAAILPSGEIRAVLVEEGEGSDPMQRARNASQRIRAALEWLSPVGHVPVVALEWQRPLPTDKRPKNICDLSAFAGICLATVEGYFQPFTVYTVLPEEWKGSSKKWAKHNWIVKNAGRDKVVAALNYGDIPVPANLGSFTKEFTGKAGNALDAIGLAQWAKTKHWIYSKIPAPK